jgi:hypothetical protein
MHVTFVSNSVKREEIYTKGVSIWGEIPINAGKGILDAPKIY